MLGKTREAGRIYAQLLLRGLEELKNPDADAEECWEGADWTRGLVMDCIFRIAGGLAEIGGKDEAVEWYNRFLSLLDQGAQRGIYSRGCAGTAEEADGEQESCPRQTGDGETPNGDKEGRESVCVSAPIGVVVWHPRSIHHVPTNRSAAGGPFHVVSERTPAPMTARRRRCRRWRSSGARLSATRRERASRSLEWTSGQGVRRTRPSRPSPLVRNSSR